MTRYEPLSWSPHSFKEVWENKYAKYTYQVKWTCVLYTGTVQRDIDIKYVIIIYDNITIYRVPLAGGLARARSQSSSPAAINHRRVARGCPGRGAGFAWGWRRVRFSYLLHVFTREISDEPPLPKSITLYYILYALTVAAGGSSSLATDRRPPALAFANKSLSLSLLLYTFVSGVGGGSAKTKRRHLRRATTVGWLMISARRPRPINHPLRRTRVGGIRADGFGVWSSVEVFHASPCRSGPNDVIFRSDRVMV